MTLNERIFAKPVYERRWCAVLLCALTLSMGLIAAPAARAQSGDNTILDAREAYRKKEYEQISCTLAQ